MKINKKEYFAIFPKQGSQSVVAKSCNRTEFGRTYGVTLKCEIDLILRNQLNLKHILFPLIKYFLLHIIIILLILLDFSKAFDKVNHLKLLYKLQLHGVEMD